MTQHYTKNTTAVLAYCPTCNRKTRHRVSDGRQGSCLEHEAKLSKAQERRKKQQDEDAKNPRMF